MNVYLAGSIHDHEADTARLKTIAEIVEAKRATVSHSWTDDTLNHQQKQKPILDWEPIVTDNVKAIRQSDIAIIDATHNSFSQGFLMSIAVDLKKPTLVLVNDLSLVPFSKISKSYLLTFAEYKSSEELTRHVEGFIRKNTIFTKDLRFNLLFTKRIFKYLQDRSDATGQSKSDIVRDIIKQNAEKQL